MSPSSSDKSFKTTCSYCGVGCGIIVKKDNKGKVHVQGDPDYPVNKGMLCSKGMNLHYVVEDTSDRILYPQMRFAKNLPKQRVNWDAALDRAAAVFKSLIRKYGPDSVGFYVSGQCLTEEYYIVNKLVKGYLQTNNIDTNSRLCMSSAVAGYKMTLGEDSVPASYDDIELADCFLIAGANPAWCHPILFRRLEAHKERNPQIKIIVVDPRKTQTCAIADLHLQINPGTDITLFNAIAQLLIVGKYIDHKFILNHTEGFEELKKSVFTTSLKEAAEICDVPEEDIIKAAELIGTSKGFMSMWTMGLNQSAVGVNKNLALLNLSIITGKIGKPGCGPLSLTGQPNAMGGREVGGMANLLSAHRNMQNPEHRKEIADFWKVSDVPAKPGLTATEMFEALEDGRLKAIWIICTNPLVSLPDVRRAEKALAKANFVVVQDISYLSDTVPYADLLLPAAGWLEKEGTMTNSERRISYLNKVIDAPGEALPDTEILIHFAKKMGFPGFDYNNVSEIFDEHCKLTKGTNIDISGLSYEKLKSFGSIQWPVSHKDHQGTKRLFEDFKFFRENQKAKIHAVDPTLTSEKPDRDHPLILTTGRIRDQWHTRTKTGKVQKLKKHIPKAFLEIHPVDAALRKIEDGDVIEVFNERGSARLTAKVTTEIKPGVVFAPMHWGKIFNNDFSRTNNLTNSLVDPVSKEPDFKYCKVQVIKYKKPFEKILIVGAGAAAYRFVASYREMNQEDEIHVFSKEPYPFYNRVLLPEYVNGHLSWEKLNKLSHDDLEKWKINLHLSNSIVKVNKEHKYVIDEEGQQHFYDKLILCTGSSPFVPKEVPLHLPGIFTMRSRKDAEDLKSHLRKESHVLIVGGGLLGLEMAASLKVMDVEVSIIQLSNKLMERQLDDTSAELLQGHIEELGIKIHLNNQVQTIIPLKEGGFKVILRSGKKINCDAAIYAIGTRPNIELAKEAGLECHRGVIVNAYLQTSDPSIFAMGEIAEFENMLYGITSSAEQQADIAAHYLNGDLSSYYEGSVLMNILKFPDLDLCSVGNIFVPEGDPDYEEIIFIDRAKRYYKKCVVYQDKLVGAILLGDKNEFAEFKTLIETKTELGEKRLSLLRSGQAPKPVIGKLVCSCNNVGEGNLQEAIRGGCSNLKDLCSQTGAGTGCGSCKPEIKALIDKETCKKEPVKEELTL